MAMLTVAQGIPAGMSAKNKDSKENKSNKETKSLIDSAPVLQNYAEQSMGVAFSVTDLANGYVIYGQEPDLSDGKKVYCGGYRMTDMNDQVILVRLNRLQSNTKYYYKIGADRIHFGGGYDMKIIETQEDNTIYSFKTAGKKAKGHFCVINDTHAQWQQFSMIIDKIAQLAPECVVWNGDACNTEETVETQKQIFLKPNIKRKDYASSIPYLFCSGNHDVRGRANRHIDRIWMYRQPEERSSRDWDLGRNFAVRMGDIAMIGLDTGEDKQDTHPAFANLFCSGPYREAQTEWLRDVLKKKEVASAPYLVAFCHIPLFDDDPKANPGDITPDDTDPRYRTDYAAWQRTCGKMWGPLLDKAGCQLVICGHQHKYRHLLATKDRSWSEVIGGGLEIKDKESDRFPTVIEGIVQGKELLVRIHNIATNEVCDEIRFKRR